MNVLFTSKKTRLLMELEAEELVIRVNPRHGLYQHLLVSALVQSVEDGDLKAYLMQVLEHIKETRQCGSSIATKKPPPK